MINKRTIQFQDDQNGTYQGFINEQNKKDNFGVYLWDSGDFYIGEWKDNKMNGQGIIYFSTGGYLEGFFQDSLVCNRSLIVFPNNDKYLANWKKGNLDGKVIMHFKQNSKLYTANYENGQFRTIESIKENIKDVKSINDFIQKCDIRKLIQKIQNQLPQTSQYDSATNTTTHDISFSKINFHDGGFYIGVTQNNIPNGLGLFYYSDQKFDCGIYQNGFLSGYGRKNFPNGDLYDGHFNQGKFQGDGIIYHKIHNRYNYGTFKNNIITDEKSQGEGFPKELLNQLKTNDHKNGTNYTSETIPQDWMKLSLSHNIQFISTIIKQEQQTNNSKFNQNSQQQSNTSQPHSISQFSLKAKDNSQKYHQKNLDTVYYLNQKMHISQIPNGTVSSQKDNKDKSKEGTHRKNQASIDLIKKGIDYHSNPDIRQKKLNNQQEQQDKIKSFILKQGKQNQNEDFKNKSIQDKNESYEIQQNNEKQTRKHSVYLSPPARTASSQYSLISPNAIKGKNNKVTNSPIEKNNHQIIEANKNNQNKILRKELLSPQPTANVYSPLSKAQKVIDYKLTLIKSQISSSNQAKKQNTLPQNNQKNVSKKQTSNALISQKSQPSLNRVASPDLKYVSMSKNTSTRVSELQPVSQEDIKQQLIQQEYKSIDNFSIDRSMLKEQSTDALRSKSDSQGDLLAQDNNNMNNNNRGSQLSTQSIYKPKNSIPNNGTLQKQKSYENKAFIQGSYSQLNNTPQRLSHQSTNLNNSEAQKKNSGFQSEQAMKHYYQTRIKKQTQEENSVERESIKNKQSANIINKSSTSSKFIGSYSITQKQKQNQNSMTPYQQKQNIKNNNTSQPKNSLLQQKKGFFHSSLKIQQTNNDTTQSQKKLKNLISVKSQDHLTNEQNHSFSSTHSDQQTKTEEQQKSKYIVQDQQMQIGLTCFTQQDDQEININEVLKDDGCNNNRGEEEDELFINNENQNYMNQQNIINQGMNYQNLIIKSEGNDSEPLNNNKGIQEDNQSLSNQILDKKDNQNEFKTLRSTISDQIKHILSMQKSSIQSNNQQKQKYSMKPFIHSGINSKVIKVNKENTKNESNLKIGSSLSSQYKDSILSQISSQNYQKQQQQLKSQNNQTNFQQEKLDERNGQYPSNISDNQENLNEEDQINIEKKIINKEKHILTPFHQPKNTNQQYKLAQSCNSQNNKTQNSESIRSINQKMSSYLSFQERLNAIGQCIYKKDWNTAQSLTSVKSLSRNNSTLVEKNQFSEDSINVMNPFSTENIDQIQKLNFHQNIFQKQQQQPNINIIEEQEDNINFEKIYIENNVNDIENINQKLINDMNNNIQEIKSDQFIKVDQVQNELQIQKQLENNPIILESQTLTQELQFQNENTNQKQNEIINIESNSIGYGINNNKFSNQDYNEFEYQINNGKLLHSSKQQNINELIQHNSNKIFEEQNINSQIISSDQNLEIQLANQNQEMMQKQVFNKKIEINKNEIIHNQVLLDQDYNQNSENQNAIFLSDIKLEQEEEGVDEMNKNDLACFQLKEFNGSDILANNESLNNESSCNLNELQINQKHFNEENLFGINVLEEVFSQNDESHCSFSPAKQDFDNNIQKYQFNQQDINNKFDQEDDIEFQKIFDCQINLENLDIFTLSSQNDNFNENNIKDIRQKNNQNLNFIKTENIKDDISDLSPIKIKESDSDDQFQSQMITEFHFYEDILMQKIPHDNTRNKNIPNNFENNCLYNQKYRPVLESIKENASEDKYTSPKKKQRFSFRQIFQNSEDHENIVTQIQF